MDTNSTRMTKETKRAAVVRMYLAGAQPPEVADTLGITLASVYSTASHAREVGLLPPRQTRIRRAKFDAGMKLMRYRCVKAGDERRVGSITEIANTLTPAQIKWLVRITPPGETVALTIRSILIDAFHEEMGR